LVLAFLEAKIAALQAYQSPKQLAVETADADHRFAAPFELLPMVSLPARQPWSN